MYSSQVPFGQMSVGEMSDGGQYNDCVSLNMIDLFVPFTYFDVQVDLTLNRDCNIIMYYNVSGVSVFCEINYCKIRNEY